MSTWKEKISQGNACFDKKHWQLAEKAYLDAASELEQAWFANLDNIQLMMAWIANMHNLATLYEVTDRPQIASTYFTLPYRRIVILTQEESLPQAFQQALYLAMRSTIIPLLEFSQRYPICQCCQTALTKMKEWIAHYPLEATNSTGRNAILPFQSITTKKHQHAPSSTTLH